MEQINAAWQHEEALIRQCYWCKTNKYFSNICSWIQFTVSWDSTVSKLTRLQTRWPQNHASITSRDNRFSPSPGSRSALEPTPHPIQQIERACSPEVKQLKHANGDSPPSSTKV